MAALQDLFMKNATEDEVVAIATAYCIDMKIEDELVCTAVVLEFKVLVHVGIVRRLWTLCPQDEVLIVFDQVALSPNEVCVILLGPSCGNPYSPWNQTWTVKLPPTPRPPVVPVPPPKVYTYMHTSYNVCGNRVHNH